MTGSVFEGSLEDSQRRRQIFKNVPDGPTGKLGFGLESAAKQREIFEGMEKFKKMR
jgi:hypothetical protein